MERVDYQPFLVQDVINWHRADGLNLRPWYQRRLTWTNQQRAYLVNTLFMQMPVPSIYLRHYLDADKEESKREIVDGQQRIHSILTYVEDGFRAKHPNHKKPVLYSELKPREREAFRLTQLSIGVLLGATDEDVIEIFGRINSVMKTLNQQEKRNSKYSGEFKQFCLQQSAKGLAIWKGLGIFTPNNIVRMAEVQFVAELVINLVEGIVDYMQNRSINTMRCTTKTSRSRMKLARNSKGCSKRSFPWIRMRSKTQYLEGRPCFLPCSYF